MKPHELFALMSLAQATEIFTWLQAEQKPVYKAAISGLAAQRNLRAVFVERKAPAERYPWMKSALGHKHGNGVAEHIVQAWLLGAQKKMLCDFLDALGIAHGGDGTVENIPTSPPREQIASAVDRLLANYPREAVAIYLQSFCAMDLAAAWPALQEMLRDDARLRLG
ncbi:MAG: hypothetical protein M3R59_02055 [Verrucomicrobiota bacterium]|nr:hypothetical protein [Verrucomicrobiota bacterium]